MASASQGLRCLFALLLPLVVAVRPGDDASSGKTGRLESNGAGAFEALIEMATRPVEAHTQQVNASQKDPLGSETSLLMSEQLSHVIEAITEEHKAAKAHLLGDKVRMRQIDQQLAESEALLRMLDDQIRKLQEAKGESIRDSKASLAIAAHDRDRDEQVGYEAMKKPLEESIRWWDDTTSKSPMEFERGDDTVVDTSRGTELEGPVQHTNETPPDGGREASIQETLKTQIKSLSTDQMEDEDENVGGLLQLQDQLSFGDSEEVLLEQVRQQVAEAKSTIIAQKAERSELQESVEDYESIAASSESQLVDLLRMRDEAAHANAAAGHAVASD
mmetsp:Transcript_16781/g.37637  ORF Transcript_16781/g.37637 Transcript_16781/m.37637 type:complete len:332 (+) Transcript_16781:64-1059(+)